jgi:hypothetical protein
MLTAMAQAPLSPDLFPELFVPISCGCGAPQRKSTQSRYTLSWLTSAKVDPSMAGSPSRNQIFLLQTAQLLNGTGGIGENVVGI